MRVLPTRCKDVEVFAEMWLLISRRSLSLLSRVDYPLRPAGPTPKDKAEPRKSHQAATTAQDSETLWPAEKNHMRRFKVAGDTDQWHYTDI